jgi:hypothetical protein
MNIVALGRACPKAFRSPRPCQHVSQERFGAVAIVAAVGVSEATVARVGVAVATSGKPKSGLGQRG